ncbi:acyltransferase family protein [Planosporangium sp. 12N6]|uniref:acyltransferase family protein n=1 Tax=Planosporangium spinosum TaxID=3402278 RepID=UPI003CF4AF3E
MSAAEPTTAVEPTPPAEPTTAVEPTPPAEPTTAVEPTPPAEASAPDSREPTIDALRALAVVGVVTGHWLVTAVVVDPVGWAVASPLRAMPALTPLTWLLQTLAPLFLAAGYAAFTSLGRAPRYLPWLAHRVGQAARAVGYLVAFWLPLLLVLALTGTPFAVLHRIGWYVVSPLWFLAVLVVLLALTPVLTARTPVPVAVGSVAVVAADDLARSGPWPVPTGVPAVLGAAAVLCGWLLPYAWGVALARTDRAEPRTGRIVRQPTGTGTGWIVRRRTGAVLVVAGAVAAVLLVAGAGYPASMVGGTGTRSNLDPPSLLQIAFAALQIGLFLLVRPWLAATARHRWPWRPVAAVNRLAMPVYLWHQSALVLLILCSALVAPAPGLVDAPSGPRWLLHRLCWLPAVAAVLAGLLATVGARPRPRPRRSTR